MILYKMRFRSVLILMILLDVLMLYVIYQSSRDKNDYQQTSGEIIYLDKKLGSLPTRNLGKYRYLKLGSYPYPFEVYADEQSSVIDKLNLGDTVTAYFYETGSTQNDQLNRYLQFLEKDHVDFFKRTNFNILAGFVVIGISMIVTLATFLLYKRGKILY